MAAEANWGTVWSFPPSEGRALSILALLRATSRAAFAQKTPPSPTAQAPSGTLPRLPTERQPPSPGRSGALALLSGQRLPWGAGGGREEELGSPGSARTSPSACASRAAAEKGRRRRTSPKLTAPPERPTCLSAAFGVGWLAGPPTQPGDKKKPKTKTKPAPIKLRECSCAISFPERRKARGDP